MRATEIKEGLEQLYSYRERLETLMLEPIFHGFKWELIRVKDEISVWGGFLE